MTFDSLYYKWTNTVNLLNINTVLAYGYLLNQVDTRYLDSTSNFKYHQMQKEIRELLEDFVK